MYTIRHIITIHAPQHLVYQYLLGADFLNHTGVLHAGDSMKIIFNDHFKVSLQIHELIPGRCLVLDQPAGNTNWNGTEISFDIAQVNSHTSTMRMAHSNWKDQNDVFATCNFRWAQLLENFKTTCEQRSMAVSRPVL
jgi:hypothetical protein